MGGWLFILFLYLFLGFIIAAEEMDKRDFKSGEQKRRYGTYKGQKYTEDGDNTKAVMWFFLILFVLGVILLGGIL